MAGKFLYKPKAGYRKYGNIKVTVGGVKYDSKKEAKRGNDLKMLMMASEVRNLRTQVPYKVHINGVLIFKYVADFVYEEKRGLEWHTVVEDVKSPATRKNSTYRIKKKAIEATYGFVIKES